MKIILNYLLQGIVIFLITQCAKQENIQKEEEQVIDIKDTPRDPHTFANTPQTIMEHIELDLNVDFKKQQISGTAKINFKNNGSDVIILDTKNLTIESVKIGDRETPYTLHEEIPHMGSALEVSIDTFTTSISIKYSTQAGAEALQWLSPSQTSGKRLPFLFTQSQAILARTWVPCQDSPGIRFTYKASVQVPKNMLALMSASNPTEKNDDGIYHFEMNQPVPAYLLALVVGDLTFQEISDRTGVYAEAQVVNKAKSELEDMEAMLKAAENLYGPYQWERYDVVFLPPSFPFGGMENPRLTFATPTILAGDKSLVSLVAHELAHSWSGNLVTNATWNDFWLNEGFTVYFEYRIMEEVYGKDVSEMLSLISYSDLNKELEALDYGEDTKLKLNLAGRNPDEGVTSIAYEKGYYFLKLIEQTVGKENFDDFLVKYFNHFAYKSIDTESFLTYLEKNLLDSFPEAKATIQIDKWVYNTGLPENCPIIASTRFANVKSAADTFISENVLNGSAAREWLYQEWVYFLRNVSDSITYRQMALLDKDFRLSNSGNSEILFEWLMLAVKHDYTPAYSRLERFLKTVGRRKFIAPLYQAMADNPKLSKRAKTIYTSARPSYHFVAVNSIDKILNVSYSE